MEHALQFERMAAEEADHKLRASFEQQAAAYRKLATSELRRSEFSGSICLL
jgi:hypothetical protein